MALAQNNFKYQWVVDQFVVVHNRIWNQVNQWKKGGMFLSLNILNRIH